MYRIKYVLILTCIIAIGITGCNPVGETVDTVPCDEVYINSSLPVTLKKGDKSVYGFKRQVLIRIRKKKMTNKPLKKKRRSLLLLVSISN